LQKYERGANRVGASRLAAIARALNVPISYFFPDDDAEMPATVDVAARIADIEKRLDGILKELRQLRKLF
jgi:transcriptional regulator with XRE-family HTH domain